MNIEKLIKIMNTRMNYVLVKNETKTSVLKL